MQKQLSLAFEFRLGFGEEGGAEVEGGGFFCAFDFPGAGDSAVY